MPIKFTNNASSTIAGAISASDVGVVLASGTGDKFPTLASGEYFYATITSPGGTQEIVKVTARTGDVVAIVRAQENTFAANFVIGSRFESRITAQSILDASSVGEQVSVKDFGAKGDGVTDDTAAVQAAIISTTTNGQVLSFPAGNFVVNNATFTTATSMNIVGIPGRTKILRTAASGSTFLSFDSPSVSLYGITFDFNKANVTANQWGVLFPRLGGTIFIDTCKFQNNSGTLGSGISIFTTGGNVDAGSTVTILNSEISGCTWNAVYIASKSNVRIANNYIHDNSGTAIYVASYLTKSATNYSNQIEITANDIFRNSTGIQFGGFGPPYDFSVPGAKNGIISSNNIVDNYVGVALQGHYVAFSENKIYRDSPTASINAAVFCNTKYAEIYDNYINITGATWGIDIGGSVECTVKNNTVRMSSGNLLNVGGTDKCTIAENTIFASGTGFSCLVYNVEGDGSGGIFPTITSALTIRNNTIHMDGSSSRGINLLEDAGGAPGKVRTAIYGNDFYLTSSASAYYAVYCISTTANIYQNTVNGFSYTFVNPDANTNIVVPQVYDGVVTFAGSGSTFAIASVITQVQNENLAKSSIIFVHPTNGGSNYTAATTITASATGGGTGFSASPLILNGVIIGVRIVNKGLGYTGTVTITATDTGGGAGAIFSFSQFPLNAAGRLLNIASSSDANVLKRSGGAVPLAVAEAVLVGFNSSHTLQTTFGGTAWNVLTNALPSVATAAALPTASTDLTYAKAYVRGSTTNKFFARCDGTNWTFSDGTLVS